MRLVVVISLLLFPSCLFDINPTLHAQAKSPACWLELGMKPDFSSSEQLRELQRYAKASSCSVFGFAWRIKMLPNRQSLLLWDVQSGSLFRLHVDGVPTWESWSGATKQAILADVADDGFDLSGYREGRGKLPASSNAATFVKSHAPKRFDAAF